MAFRWAVAATSLWPPDKNTIPGTDAGTQSSRQATVARATSSTGAWVGASLPERTMFGLSSMPSKRTRWRRRAAKVSARGSRGARAQGWMGGRGRGVGGEGGRVGVPRPDAAPPPPLGEPGPQLAVVGQPVGQAVQAL